MKVVNMDVTAYAGLSNSDTQNVLGFSFTIVKCIQTMQEEKILIGQRLCAEKRQ